MRHIRSSNRAIPYAVALVILGLGVSGIAGAAKKPSGRQQVTGCYAKKSGVLRVITRGKRCKRGERKIAWTKSGQRGDRGPRGVRGPAGADGQSGTRGATGAAGPSGVPGAPGVAGSVGATGATGPTGPSDSFEAFNSGPVTITATDSDSANSLATLANVAAGSYVLTARVQLNAPAATAARVVCTASLGNRSGTAISDVGTTAGNVIHDQVMLTFNATLATTGTGNLKCHRDALAGTAPFASEAFLELLKVGSATSQAVSG
jgi:hypothetical protein